MIPKEEQKINGFHRWDVKSAMECIGRAKQIEADTKMMEAIGMLAKERLEELGHVLHHVDMAKSKK
jgi:sorbitol-specific phosphotransferase system component IIA